MPRLYIRGTVEQRLWAHIDKSGGPDACWPWTAYRNSLGYGTLKVPKGGKNTTAKAHRLALLYGTGIDAGALCVCHRCDNPPCCNPAHLFVGTHADNVQDKVAKGRAKGSDKSGTKNAAAKLTEADVLDIRRRSREGATRSALAREYGLAPTSISNIVLGWTWAHLPDAGALRPDVTSAPGAIPVGG